jgi:hypothetical protein
MTERSISDETDDLYAETASLVGNVAIQWNSLCETLGNIFVTLVANENRDRGYVAWHSLKSDRSQREMIEGVVKHMLPEKSKLREEFHWMFGRINSLENDRNNIVHSPYAVLFTDKSPDRHGDFELAMIADTTTGHRRAENLRGKVIRSECEMVARRIASINVYAMKLGRLAASKEPEDFPESLQRPSL